MHSTPPPQSAKSIVLKRWKVARHGGMNHRRKASVKTVIGIWYSVMTALKKTPAIFMMAARYGLRPGSC